MGAGISYGLKALFAISDTGYANGQVLDESSEGVEIGQLTAVEVTGTVEVVSEKARMTGAGVLGNTGFYGEAFTRELGRFQKQTFTKGSSAPASHHAVWMDAQNLQLNDQQHTWYANNLSRRFDIMSRTDSTLHLNLQVGRNWIDGGTYSVGIALGGYSSNVPWDGSSAGYEEGAAFFFKDGSNWVLDYRSGFCSTTPLYPGSAIITNTRTVDVDDWIVPGELLTDLLAPTVLDTFADSNGTALTARTPTVDTIGSGWTDSTGNWDIQSNKASYATSDSTHRQATIDSGLADVVIEGVVNMSSANERASVIVRYTDDNNLWRLYVDNFGNSINIYQVNGGVNTSRASASVTVANATDYRVVGVLDDDNITMYFNDATRITYASAVALKTNTVHGIHAYVNGGSVTHDNFAIYPRGTNGEYAIIDDYT